MCCAFYLSGKSCWWNAELLLWSAAAITQMMQLICKMLISWQVNYWKEAKPLSPECFLNASLMWNIKTNTNPPSPCSFSVSLNEQTWKAASTSGGKISVSEQGWTQCLCVGHLRPCWDLARGGLSQNSSDFIHPLCLYWPSSCSSCP